MKICLAGTSAYSHLQNEILSNCTNLLESYLYIKDWQIPVIKQVPFFLLDSGAYTFMAQNNGNKNYEQYLENYANFVKKNDIKNFFNLDLDYIIGIENTKKLTQKLEKIAERQCIPVYHRKMGLDAYKNLVAEYPYIAIGTIREFRKDVPLLRKLVNYANFHNCKVHGLGYTPTKNLSNLYFYSVDSTTWLGGDKFGCCYKFNGHNITRIDKPVNSYVSANTRQTLRINNFREWCKYQKYMEG